MKRLPPISCEMFPGARHYSVLARSASGSSYTFIICKMQKKSSPCEKAGEQHGDTTNNRACVVYAEQAARDLVAVLQLADARFQLRNTLLFGGLVLMGWAAV